MNSEEAELLKNLSIADLERAQAYARDLGHGLEIIRTFPQGVTIFGSARIKADTKFYNLARTLGGELAKNGHTVVTGGGPGIMEAASLGAYEIGGRTIGFNITLQHEQFPNPYLTDCLTSCSLWRQKFSSSSQAVLAPSMNFPTFSKSWLKRKCRLCQSS